MREERWLLFLFFFLGFKPTDAERGNRKPGGAAPPLPANKSSMSSISYISISNTVRTVVESAIGLIGRRREIKLSESANQKIGRVQ